MKEILIIHDLGPSENDGPHQIFHAQSIQVVFVIFVVKV